MTTIPVAHTSIQTVSLKIMRMSNLCECKRRRHRCGGHTAVHASSHWQRTVNTRNPLKTSARPQCVRAVLLVRFHLVKRAFKKVAAIASVLGPPCHSSAIVDVGAAVARVRRSLALQLTHEPRADGYLGDERRAVVAVRVGGDRAGGRQRRWGRRWACLGRRWAALPRRTRECSCVGTPSGVPARPRCPRHCPHPQSSCTPLSRSPSLPQRR